MELSVARATYVTAAGSEFETALSEVDLRHVAFGAPFRIPSSYLLRERGHTGPRFQATKMIADVAAYMARKDRWLRRAIMHHWMRGSAAAHSRMWVTHIIETEDEPIPGGGSMRRVTSSVSDIAQAYGAPTLVLSEALDLWERRRRRQTPPLLLVPLPGPSAPTSCLRPRP
ncbi:hypothetical protein [Cellulomonas shaoxiangyii]|uniref:Uncharacterized protein n=1 Tax=Cellulomonas shaoxiangyii TaxID=2566013 RepID=A0A4P7SP52_9CELL|nr:hypothetical protein [Cellulomonas shaoxiangyii]QCB94744.1 hypothetical protein E5225_15450 [Cellulomonas shaoxiangyii]TGY86474.1 hypothetical protein E5226_01475 [Cellulomonas shaoxiangyii]